MDQFSPHIGFLWNLWKDFFRDNNCISFCFNNCISFVSTIVFLFVSTTPLLYRKPVCVRIAIAFFLGREHEEDGKEENLAVLKPGKLPQQQQQSYSSSSSSSSRRTRADCEMQVSSTAHWLFHDNTSGGGAVKVARALRAADNFLISSPIFHSLT